MNNQERLSKAKTQLVLEHPFIGTIALQKLVFSIEPEQWFNDMGMPATAAVSDKEAVFCSEFMETLNDDELKFLVAHECMHPMLEHNFRLKGRDPALWNQAADYVINYLLRKEGIGRMPECGLYDEALYQKGKGVSESIYEIIREVPPEQDPNGSGGDGSGGDKPMDSIIGVEGTPAEIEQQANEWRIAVAQAAQSAKMMGKLSGTMERFVSEILSPQVDWRDVLSRFIEKARTDERSFARPNRRFITQGMYMPTVSGEQVGEIVFAVDCSGSISDKELSQYAAEVRKVQEDIKPKALYVVYFDHAVKHIDKFTPDDEIEINAHGGGGTAFSPIFAKLDDLDIEPEACIVLTDLCSKDFGQAPQYPVLWISNYASEAPFGEVVKV